MNTAHVIFLGICILHCGMCSSHAQTCPTRLQLRPVPATSRGGTIIWKSNWNVLAGRESFPSEGNHSAKGGALLIQYKATKYIPSASRMEIRDVQCKLVAYAGRYPRCTSIGCGDHERWYLRAPGGSYLTIPALEAKLGGVSALFRLSNRRWAVVQSVYSDRETVK